MENIMVGVLVLVIVSTGMVLGLLINHVLNKLEDFKETLIMLDSMVSSLYFRDIPPSPSAAPEETS